MESGSDDDADIPRSTALPDSEALIGGEDPFMPGVLDPLPQETRQDAHARAAPMGLADVFAPWWVAGWPLTADAPYRDAETYQSRTETFIDEPDLEPQTPSSLWAEVAPAPAADAAIAAPGADERSVTDPTHAPTPEPVAASVPDPLPADRDLYPEPLPLVDSVPPLVQPARAQRDAAEVQAVSRGLFDALRPHCVAIVDAAMRWADGAAPAVLKEQRDSMAFHLGSALALLASADPAACRACFTYVSFALTQVVRLGASAGDSCLERSLQCEAALTRRGGFVPLPSLLQWLDVRLELAAGRDPTRRTPSGVPQHHATAAAATTTVLVEEVRLASIEAISALLSAVAQAARWHGGPPPAALVDMSDTELFVYCQAARRTATMLASKQARVLVGYLLSVLLGAAANEKGRDVKLAALGALDALVDVLHARSVEADGLPVVLGGFLPGICASLFKLATGDYKLGGAVVARAVQCWVRFLLCTLGDDALCAASDEVKRALRPPAAGRVPVRDALAALRLSVGGRASSGSASGPQAQAAAAAAAATGTLEGGGSDDYDDEAAALAAGGGEPGSLAWLRVTRARITRLLVMCYEPEGGPAVVRACDKSARARLAFVEGAWQLLCSCALALPDALTSLLDYIVACECDATLQVRTAAADLLAILTDTAPDRGRMRPPAPTRAALLSHIEERVVTKLSALPRMLRSGSGASQLLLLRCVLACARA
jgi:hypothetical protein